jgi:hypothetical protein
MPRPKDYAIFALPPIPPLRWITVTRFDQGKMILFEYLVGDSQQGLRKRKMKCFGSVEIEN